MFVKFIKSEMIFYLDSIFGEAHLELNIRSGCRRSSVRKSVYENFAKFTGNTCARVFF